MIMVGMGWSQTQEVFHNLNGSEMLMSDLSERMPQVLLPVPKAGFKEMR